MLNYLMILLLYNSAVTKHFWIKYNKRTLTIGYDSHRRSVKNIITHGLDHII